MNTTIVPTNSERVIKMRDSLINMTDRAIKAELEIERLKSLLTECDGKLGRKPCQTGRCMEFVRLKEALEFYADPETYFGIAVIGDSPCGAFIEDFSDDHEHPYLDGPRYGKVARSVLNTENKS